METHPPPPWGFASDGLELEHKPVIRQIFLGFLSRELLHVQLRATGQVRDGTAWCGIWSVRPAPELVFNFHPRLVPADTVQSLERRTIGVSVHLAAGWVQTDDPQPDGATFHRCPRLQCLPRQGHQYRGHPGSSSVPFSATHPKSTTKISARSIVWSSPTGTA